MRKIQKVTSSMAALLAVLAFTQVPFTASAHACKGKSCQKCAHDGKKAKNCKCSDCAKGAEHDSGKSEEHKAE